MSEKWEVEHWFTGADGTDYWNVYGPDTGPEAGSYSNKDHAELIAAAPETARQRDRLRGLLNTVHGMFGPNDLGMHLHAEIEAAIAECEPEAGT